MSEVLSPSFEVTDTFQAETLCLLIGEKERPLTGLSRFVDWRLCGRLSTLLLENRFAGKSGEYVMMPAFGRLRADTLLLVGTGHSTLSRDDAQHLATVLKKTKTASVVVAFPDSISQNQRQETCGFLEGAMGDTLKAIVHSNA